MRVQTRRAAAVAIAGVAGVALSAGPTHAAPTSAVWTCADAQVKPARMNIWCYHASVWTVGMEWTGWTARKATATGTYVVNTCEISCAEGPFRKYPARFTFSKPKPFKAFKGYQTRLSQDTRLFTRLKVRFTNREPDYWSGEPWLLVKERNPGTRRCELVWEPRDSRFKRC